MCDYMKEPCKDCPFRTDVTPFLHPYRAEEISYAALNPYNYFYCHKTTVSGEEFGGEEGEMVATNTSKICAGFLTLRAQAGIETPEGFNPDYEKCYIDPYDMIQAYEEQWENKRGAAK